LDRSGARAKGKSVFDGVAVAAFNPLDRDGARESGLGIVQRCSIGAHKNTCHFFDTSAG